MDYYHCKLCHSDLQWNQDEILGHECEDKKTVCERCIDPTKEPSVLGVKVHDGVGTSTRF